MKEFGQLRFGAGMSEVGDKQRRAGSVRKAAAAAASPRRR